MLSPKKPSLAIIVGDALAKKGMAAKSEPDGEEEGSEDHMEYLKEIAGDIIKAVQDKDPEALADLLKEAFMCLESEPHEEAGKESY